MRGSWLTYRAYPLPPVFLYEGETKGLQETGSYQGERKELGDFLL
jgi:hypothetical protein